MKIHLISNLILLFFLLYNHFCKLVNLVVFLSIPFMLINIAFSMKVDFSSTRYCKNVIRYLGHVGLDGQN